MEGGFHPIPVSIARMMVSMIPNITRGSNPAGLLKYLFGPGRANEHHHQHVIAASGDLTGQFDLDGQPTGSFRKIEKQFDRNYLRLKREGEDNPPDRRGKHNPEKQCGKDRIWHCSLAIKAGHDILTNQQWVSLAEDYLKRMGLDEATWIAVRHGLSKTGNDHIHLMVNLAGKEGWYNPYHDRIQAQEACRSMEETYPYLEALDSTANRQVIRFQQAEYWEWAQWKAHHDWDETHPGCDWNTLTTRQRQALANQVKADTMPKQRLGLLVAALAKDSHSEDEFIRRVRREGLMIDPRLKKGVTKGDFTDASQVVGYTITWKSADGWRQRFNAYDLGKELTLKQLRRHWAADPRSTRLAALEWQASMNHHRPVMRQGAEKQADNLTVHDMCRIIDQAFTILQDTRFNLDDPHAVNQAVRRFDQLYNSYGITWNTEQSIEIDQMAPLENEIGENPIKTGRNW